MKRILRYCAGCLTALTLLAAIQLPIEATSFSDVNVGHWGHLYIEKAVEQQWVSGTGEGKFAPDGPLTAVQFHAMLVNAFSADALDAALGAENWRKPYLQAEQTLQLFQASGYSANNCDDALSRYGMAVMMQNLLQQKNVAMPNEQQIQAAQTDIADFERIPEQYRNAVATVYAMNLLSGRDEKGTFGGAATLTRAEGAVVLCRMSDVISDTSIQQTIVQEKNSRLVIGTDNAQQVKTVLGEPKAMYTNGDGRIWYTYYNDDYSDYIAVELAQDIVSVVYVSEGAAQASCIVEDRVTRSIEMQDPHQNDIVYARYYYTLGQSGGLTDTRSMEMLIFEMTNAYRNFNELPTLNWDERLSVAARKHCEHMYKNNYFEHITPAGVRPEQRVAAEGYPYVTCGENLALTAANPAYVLQAWVRSELHRKALISTNYADVGVGCYIVNGNVYAGQDFGRT